MYSSYYVKWIIIHWMQLNVIQCELRLGHFDQISRMITLTLIPLSAFHCNASHPHQCRWNTLCKDFHFCSTKLFAARSTRRWPWWRRHRFWCRSGSRSGWRVAPPCWTEARILSGHSNNMWRSRGKEGGRQTVTKNHMFGKNVTWQFFVVFLTLCLPFFTCCESPIREEIYDPECFNRSYPIIFYW